MQPQQNPYSAPSNPTAAAPPMPNDTAGGLYVGREGNQLVIQQMAGLPAFCVKTGQPANHFVRRKFTWHHPLIFLTILAGLLVYVILALALRKTTVVHIPLSAEEYRKRGRKRLIYALLMISCAIGLLAAIVFLAAFGQTATESMKAVAVTSLPIMFLLLVIFAVAHGYASNILRPAKITDHHAWFKGCHPTYLSHVEAYSAQMQQMQFGQQQNVHSQNF